VLIKPGETFAGLERFLDRPPPACDLHQHPQRHRLRCVAAVERQLTGGAVAAGQQQSAPVRHLEVDHQRAAHRVAARLPKHVWQRLSAGTGVKGHRYYDWAFADTDPTVAADGEDISDTAFLKVSA
jgi:hypothetical protein